MMSKSGVKDSIAQSGFGGALDWWLRKRQSEKREDADDGASAISFGHAGLSSMPKTEEESRRNDKCFGLAKIQ